MIGGSRRGTPNFLLSLNDTLTCGFGASLLLFFVFAVLVVFDEEGHSDGEIGLLANASGRALRPEELAGDPQLFLRIASSDPEFIKAILVPSPDEWMWQAKPMLGRKGETSLLVLHWTGSAPRQPLDFKLPKGVVGTMHLTAMLGGTLLTPNIGMHHVHNGDTELLFEVYLGGAEPISFPDDQ